jgi:hypothetical protein
MKIDASEAIVGDLPPSPRRELQRSRGINDAHNESLHAIDPTRDKREPAPIDREARA